MQRRAESNTAFGVVVVSSLASFDVQCSGGLSRSGTHRYLVSSLASFDVQCSGHRRFRHRPALDCLIACIVRCAMQRPAPQVERIAAVKRPSASVPRRPAAGPFSRCALGGRKCLESLGFERPLSFTCHVAARRFRLRRSLLNHYTDLLGLLFHLFQKIKPRQ